MIEKYNSAIPRLLDAFDTPFIFVSIILFLILAAMAVYGAFRFRAQDWLWLLVFFLTVSLLSRTYFLFVAQKEIVRLNNLSEKKQLQERQR